MTDAPTHPDLPPPCPANETDWAQAFALRRLQILGELAELGLDVARAIERQASGRADVAAGVSPASTPASPVFHGDPALAYARASRAVRLTLMLQARMIDDIKAAERAAVTARAAADAEWVRANPQDLRPTPELQRKVRVENIVERLVEAEHPDDEEALETLMGEACERLDDEDRYGDILQRPLSEIVARLCKDLGLDPDWAGLARELWAVREVESGDVGWPLVAAVPLQAGEPRPSEHRLLKDALAQLQQAEAAADTG